MKKLITIFLILLAATVACGCFSWDYVPEDLDFYPAMDNCTVVQDGASAPTDAPAPEIIPVSENNTGGKI